MRPQIFVNLHVKDLKKSIDFYGKIGFKNKAQFTDETAACMVLSEEIYVMLLTHEKFKEFTPKDVSDANKTTEVLNALALPSKGEVDALMDKAIAEGGSVLRPTQDYGFMYSKGFNDPDGHIWEVFWMDPNYVK
ncbi:MAG: VOC family protein [Bacteroidota bacterium]|nr:VOC family protein [Bacteroidota bacterium]